MSKVVAVTGANGYIAAHLVKLLLEQGYTVRGTVRNPSDTAKNQHILSLPGAEERLTLHQADLLTGDFNSIFEGCEGVFHTASPHFWATTDPEKDLIQPALQGTRIVLEACANVESVKKCVLTSSCVAVYMGTQKLHYTEDDWSPEDVLRRLNLWYPVSKVVAERWAWEYHGQNSDKFKLAVVNPTLVLGEMLQNELNESSKFLLDYLNGTKKVIPNSAMAFVDVKDVAQVHLLAYEKEVEGRIINVGVNTSWQRFCDILREVKPDAPVPTELENTPFQDKVADNTKSINLGAHYRSLEETLADNVNSLVRLGYLN